jgi:hypothetical protein
MLQCLLRWARTQNVVDLPLASKIYWRKEYKATGATALSVQQEAECLAYNRVGFIFSMYVQHTPCVETGMNCQLLPRIAPCWHRIRLWMRMRGVHMCLCYALPNKADLNSCMSDDSPYMFADGGAMGEQVSHRSLVL